MNYMIIFLDFKTQRCAAVFFWRNLKVISVSFLETKDVFFNAVKHRDAPSSYHIAFLTVV